MNTIAYRIKSFQWMAEKRITLDTVLSVQSVAYHDLGEEVKSNIWNEHAARVRASVDLIDQIISRESIMADTDLVMA